MCPTQSKSKFDLTLQAKIGEGGAQSSLLFPSIKH